MMNATPVFQNSRVPLYLQVAKLMRHRIENGEWRYGAQIPTLDKLEREYKVSRITLRGALDQLEALGIVRRTRGLGTFVAKDLSEQRWFKLPGTLDQLVAAVAGLKIRLLAIDGDPAAALTPAFPFGSVGPAYQRLRRVHYHNDEPYCLIEIYLDRRIYDSDPVGFSSAPIVPQLAAREDVRIAHAKQLMRITVSDEDTAMHLGIGVGDPIADVCRTFLDEAEQIIYYAHIQYPAQMIQIETDLLNGAAGEQNPGDDDGKRQ
jgi:GntR family transcriptional regulator